MSRAENIRLDSWKEIASYLRRDLRTVRRWEKSRALPVHRVPGGGRGAVYAYRSEIDAWLSAKHEESAREAPLPVSGMPVLGTAPSNELEDASPFTNHKKSPPTSFGSKRAILAFSAIGFSFLLLIAFKTHSVNGSDVATVSFSGSQLLAQSNGKLAWSYDFGQPLRNLTPEEAPFKFQIQDWNGNGQRETQVAAPLLVFERGDLATDALFSFSSAGKLLWQHAFNDRIHFGGEDSGPRWEISRLMATGEAPAKSLWFTICSFPTSVSVVMSVDANGRISRKFVNYGHLHALNEVHTASGTFLLTGGINNESGDGALAVLKEAEPSGRSPQDGALAQCDNCPPGQPYRYFLFPRSEVIRVEGPPYNEVVSILVTDSRIQIMTGEGSGPLVARWALYDISSEDFVPRSVFFSDHYWLAHERLSTEGKIGHALENCTERLKPVVVREWSPEKGWTRVALPPIAPHGK